MSECVLCHESFEAVPDLTHPVCSACVEELQGAYAEEKRRKREQRFKNFIASKKKLGPARAPKPGRCKHNLQPANCLTCWRMKAKESNHG